LDNVDFWFNNLTFFIIAIHDTECEIGPIAMNSKRHSDQRAEEVHVEEISGTITYVKPTNQQIDLVGCLQIKNNTKPYAILSPHPFIMLVPIEYKSQKRSSSCWLIVWHNLLLNHSEHLYSTPSRERSRPDSSSTAPSQWQRTVFKRTYLDGNCTKTLKCCCIVLYLSISIALLTAWAFQKRSRPQHSCVVNAHRTISPQIVEQS